VRRLYTAGVRLLLGVSLVATTVMAAPTAQQPPPTFRTAKTLALVDIAITDKGGWAVADLKPTDFTLTNEGRRIPVEAFYRVVDNKVAPIPSRDGASGAGVAYTPVRTFMLCFDGNIGVGALDGAKASAQAFLQAELGGGDFAGVIAGGALVRQRLFTAPGAAIEAVASVTPDSGARAAMAPPARNAADAAVSDRSGADRAEAEIAAALQDAAQRVGDGGNGSKGDRTLAELLAIVAGMHGLPGRKVIVLLSNGLPLSGTTTIDTIVEAASAAGVRIYAIDLRAPGRGDESGVPGKKNARIAPDDGLASVALKTGGLWIHNEDGLARAFDRISRDNRTYYVLGYDASAADRSDNIVIHVKRSGVAVRARINVTAR
jgi:VWFA-related protein